MASGPGEMASGLCYMPSGLPDMQWWLADMQQSLYNVPVGFMYMPFGFDNMQSSLEDMPWYMSDMQSGFLYMPSGFQYMLECAGRFVYEAWKKNLKDAYFDEKDQFMNDETTSRQIAQNAALLNADAVMSAIANPMRRAILTAYSATRSECPRVYGSLASTMRTMDWMTP